MLTGDNKAVAEHIGRMIGADEVIAEVLPEDKAAVDWALDAVGAAMACLLALPVSFLTRLGALAVLG